MTSRAPVYTPFVRRWTTPRRPLLAGERQPCGKPPFDPFLTASLLWTTHMCPVAALHDLLHGAAVRPQGGGPGATLGGEDWHEYIARLRLRIASRRVQLPGESGHALEVIRHDFDQWCYDKRIPDAEGLRFWEDYVAPYVRARLDTGALADLVDHALLPEVTIGNWQVEVPIGGGVRRYPIEARVDEIDLTAGVAIERTMLPLQEAVLYKDIQLVAAALILGSLPAAGIPQEWAAIRQVRRFVLETPDGSVEVRPNNAQFEAIHEAAAIIRDLAGSHLAEWPIRQLAQCTPINPHTVCSHPYMRCFFRVPTYPQSRAPIKREVRMLCRAQLYELLWQRDLGKYRLYMQGAAEDTFPALPIEFLGTGSDENGPYVEARLQRGSPPDFYRCAIIIGTPFVGVRRYSVSFRESPAGGGALRLYCDLQGLPLPNTGILWPAVDEGLLLEPSFDFLIRNVQNDLFWLQRIGTSDVQRRQQDSALQLLDAIFGANPPLETSR